MILHIFLTILKIAGIVLLVLVLLVAALLLAVLFSPIRYHLSGAFTEKKKSGAAEISWLLHLVSVKAFAEVLPASEKKAAADDSAGFDASVNPLPLRPEIQTGVQLRILGIDPFAVYSFFQKRKQKKAENKRARPKKSGRRKKAGQAEAGRERKQSGQAEAGRERKQCGQMEESGRANGAQQMDDSGRGTVSRQTEQERQPGHTEKSEQNETAGQVKQTGQGEAFGWTAQTGQREAAGQAEQNRQGGRAGQNSQEGRTGHTKTFLDKIRAFCERIKQIPEQIRRLVRKGKKLLRKPEQIKRKISRFFKKAEKYEAREVLLDVWEQVKKMLHHFRVRKGSGYFRFGTGDPALTGELTGVLYLLLPANCGDIQITPQFTDTMLDTELEVRGHIRLIHPVRMAWWAFFNKKLRRLIRAFRK
ncbi:MAG: DUF2953 domain-containing protein [Lachnospiraceae bacterium]|nr:DUF2953 domain-containing protein [Lachnospiraceae bacterium]